MNIFTLSAIAAIISLDVSAFGQFMISRPIVCGPIFGYFFGDIKSGLWIGMIVELIWIGFLPMGASIPTNLTAITILSICWGLNGLPHQKSTLILSLLLGLPAGDVFRFMDVWIRYFNIRIVHWIENGVNLGYEGRINKGVYFGLLIFFINSFIFYFIFLLIGQWILPRIFILIDRKFLLGLEYAWYVLPMVGFGMVLIHLKYGKLPYVKQ